MRKRRPEVDRPDDMVVALIYTLFGMMRSMVVGVVCTLGVCAKVAWDVGHPALTTVTCFVGLCGVLRVALLHLFHRADRSTMERAAALRWERAFGVLAALYCLGVGGLVLLTFTLTDYMADHFLVADIACGVSAGAMCRNAGSPKIASTQMVLLIVPLIVAALWHGQWSYFILAAINMLFIMASLEIIEGLNKNMVGLLAMTREKTELAASVATKNELLDAVLGNMSHGLCLIDAQQRLVIANPRFQALLDLPDSLIVPETPLHDVLGHDLASRLGLDASEPRVNGLDLRGEQARPTIAHLSNDRYLSVSRRPMADGGMVVLFEDVSEQQLSEARIAHLASHDPLTNLPNRTLFEDRLRSELASLRGENSCVLLCLDLDHFKTVNDTLGHAAGDFVLCETAHRMQAVVGPDRLLARIGGDEFVVLANDLGERETFVLAEAIIAAVKPPYQLDGSEVSIGVSIGAAWATDPTTSTLELRHAADLALYKAKKDGRGTVHLSASALSNDLVVRTEQRLVAVG